MPSIDTSRSPAHQAPRVNASATGTATRSNTSLTGSNPNRALACVIPPEARGAHARSQQPHRESVSDRCANTPSSSSSANNAIAIAKYTITCGGSAPPRRLAPRPCAAIAPSTMSRGTDPASNPNAR